MNTKNLATDIIASVDKISSERFTTEIKATDITLTNYKTEHDNITWSGSVKVEWEMEIESRSWGIKGFLLNTQKIDGKLYGEVWTDDNEKVPDIEIDVGRLGFKTRDDDFKIDIDNNTLPTELEIDFGSKLINVRN